MFGLRLFGYVLQLNVNKLQVQLLLLGRPVCIVGKDKEFADLI